MATTLDTAPTAKTLDIEELANQAWGGAIRVPHFQRDFRWGWEDVRRLFDSIVRGYPVGSLLLWQRGAPARDITLGALRISAPELDKAYWVVDGQQRLTSIANALSFEGATDTRFALSYDLRKGDFVRPPGTFDPCVVPLPVLFDLQNILRWFVDNPGISDYLEEATRITKTLRQYKVPAYLVESDDPKVLQDIFDRMNNFGKRLSRAEIFTALNAGDEEFHDGDKTLEGIAAGLDTDFSFGMIDSNTILASVLARRGSEVRRDIRREFDAVGDEGLNAAYEAGEVALAKAVQFLQNEAGVPHYSLLAYRYLLVVLTRVFALHPVVDARNLRLLRRWYWQAATAGPERFKGGTPNAARILCGKVTGGELSGSVQQLLAAVRVDTPHIPDVRRFATKDASSKMLLCALWSKEPMDPLRGGRYTRDDLAQCVADSRTARPAVQYLVPRWLVPVALRTWAGNRVLMPGVEVDPSEIGSVTVNQPLDLDEATWLEMLRSHVLNETSALLLDRGSYEDFLVSRQSDLEGMFKIFLGEACEWDFEDTPPLASFDLDADDDDA
jgi:hypothetical protein